MRPWFSLSSNSVRCLRTSASSSLIWEASSASRFLAWSRGSLGIRPAPGGPFQVRRVEDVEHPLAGELPGGVGSRRQHAGQPAPAQGQAGGAGAGPPAVRGRAERPRDGGELPPDRRQVAALLLIQKQV